MPFKKSDLKNWTVERDVELFPGASVTIDIKVVPSSEFSKVCDLGDDYNTAKTFTADVRGYQDDKGKPLSADVFWEDVKSFPPAVIFALASKISAAQYDAAAKNS